MNWRGPTIRAAVTISRAAESSVALGPLRAPYGAREGAHSLPTPLCAPPRTGPSPRGARGLGLITVTEGQRALSQCVARVQCELHDIGRRVTFVAGPRWWAVADRAAVAHRVRAAEARPGGGDGAVADLAEGLGVHRLRPFADLEALRATRRVSVSRFAQLAGIPGTDVLASACPAPCRCPGQRPVAGAEDRRGRGDRSQVRGGLAGVGAPQDRRDDACRRL
jgi:hypothetical protein